MQENGNEAEENQDKNGRKTSQIYLVRLENQVVWRRAGINFANTFGQRHPEEDRLSEEDTHRLILQAPGGKPIAHN